VIPNLRCKKWQGFRGTIIESPSFPACRSQMEIAVDGDWRRLATEMEGFHAQIIYGDYLARSYALKKLGKLVAAAPRPEAAKPIDPAVPPPSAPLLSAPPRGYNGPVMTAPVGVPRITAFGLEDTRHENSAFCLDGMLVHSARVRGLRRT
jgi:hypothetical protein